MSIHLNLTSSAAAGHVNFTPSIPTTGSPKVLGIGCSGSDPCWNRGGWMSIVNNTTGANVTLWDLESIPGSSMTYHKPDPGRTDGQGNPTPWYGRAWMDLIPQCQYLHIGDSPGVPDLKDPAGFHDWVDRTRTLGAGGAGGQVYLWTYQPEHPPGESDATLRARFETNQQAADRALDYTNARCPANKKLARVIPGTAVFRRMFEDTAGGSAPSATWFHDLYNRGTKGDDVIHMHAGKVSYIAACTSAAVMYGIDPKTMTSTMNEDTMLTSGEMAYVRDRISQVLKATSRHGVNTSGWS